MFEHFTSRARQTVELARQEAIDDPRGVVTTGHLLLALAERSDTQVVRAFFTDDTILIRMRRAVERVAADGREPVRGHATFSETADEAVVLGFREALDREQFQLDTGHLLLGVLRDGSDAVLVLRSLGMDDVLLRATVADDLAPRSGRANVDAQE